MPRLAVCGSVARLSIRPSISVWWLWADGAPQLLLASRFVEPLSWVSQSTSRDILCGSQTKPNTHTLSLVHAGHLHLAIRSSNSAFLTSSPPQRQTRESPRCRATSRSESEYPEQCRHSDYTIAIVAIRSPSPPPRTIVRCSVFRVGRWDRPGPEENTGRRGGNSSDSIESIVMLTL